MIGAVRWIYWGIASLFVGAILLLARRASELRKAPLLAADAAKAAASAT